jgi:peptidoglycan biosynthesis protein MviN/MurJ (putative lipid II flippase)
MAALNLRQGINTRGGTLAALQVLQVGTGLLGQFLLLARWSPDAQTDLFLLVSGVPWLVSAAVLVTGLEMALPAAYHRARAASGDPGVRQLLVQVTVLSFLTSAAAALVSGVVVALWAQRSDLTPGLSLWMGLALGAQVSPATLGGLWRGALVAEDRLIRARITLLAGSVLTTCGYALLPGPPAAALPLTAAGAVVLSAVLAGWFYRDLLSPIQGGSQTRPYKKSFRTFVNPAAYLHRYELHPQLLPLVRALLALSAAAGLVHIQAIIERVMVLPLGTGTVTALAVAGRGWDAVLAVIVAAAVLPVYPRWADDHAHGAGDRVRVLLRWSLRRAVVLSLLAALGIGLVAWFLGPRLESDLGWESGSDAAALALVLLPRFVLVSSVQPLVLKHYATGTPWVPVIGSALGVIVLTIGALALVPRYELPGVTLTTAASAIPGWLVLVWVEWAR